MDSSRFRPRTSTRFVQLRTLLIVICHVLRLIPEAAAGAMTKLPLHSSSILRRWFALVLAGLFVGLRVGTAADVRVVSSGGFAAAYRALTPEFERTTGNHLITSWGPSMGNTAEAVPQRIQRHESIDVVIMVGSALDQLAQDGEVIAGSRVDLARSVIGAAVRAGSAKPDISSVEALKRALLNAKSIAYSDSASGVYISSELFQRLGIAKEVAGKSRMIPAEPVGQVVARGEAELGFQQISELKPIAGIELLGPLPSELQKVTIFSAGVVAGAKEPEAGKALISFLASPAAAKAITDSGLQPAVSSSSKNLQR
jgi:molybdate transport system substrate-binding protein